MILFRPVGQGELDLIEQSGYKEFPPRLPEQPIIYAVITKKYAIKIAKKWNTKDKFSEFIGYVTKFEIDDDYISQFKVKQISNSYQLEYWIPAKELTNFNKHIKGLIKVIKKYKGKDKGYYLIERCPKKFIQSQFDVLLYKGFSFKEYQRNSEYEFFYSNSKIEIEIYFISGIFKSYIDFVINKKLNNKRWNIALLPLDDEKYNIFINEYKMIVNSLEIKTQLVSKYILNNLEILERDLN